MIKEEMFVEGTVENMKEAMPEAAAQKLIELTQEMGKARIGFVIISQGENYTFNIGGNTSPELGIALLQKAFFVALTAATEGTEAGEGTEAAATA